MFGQGLPDPEQFKNGSLWLHAVSVGETVAAKSIAPLLREAFPDLPLVATTITETGQDHARKILTEAEAISFFPADLSWNVERFLNAFNPKIFIIMETEIWPNFLSLAARRGTQVFMVNGRLSDRSFPGYMRARRLLMPAFNAIQCFCMQTEADAQRMAILCGRPQDVHVTGNCKFDFPVVTLSPDEIESERRSYRLGPPRPTLVVGSTHPGEEEIVLAAFEQARQKIPNLQMILSPRHPERFDEVYNLCRSHPAQWTVSRATEPVDSAAGPDIFLLDVMGKLARTYALADVAVVAGSLRYISPKIGGHNILEPAVHAVPVVVGPYMHAQKELMRLFEGPESGCIQTSAEDLAATLIDLFADSQKRQTLGAQAKATALRNQGSAKKSIAVVEDYIKGGIRGREQ